MSVREEVVGHRVSPGAPVAVAEARGEGRGEGTGAAGLTGAHTNLAVGRGAEVAEEALVRVAGVALGAQLAQLLGAHAAAAAVVQYQADAGGAARRRDGSALAPAAAVLAGGGLRREAAVSRTHAPRRRPGPSRSPARPRPPRGVSGAYPAAEGEQKHEGAADGAQAGGGHGRGATGGGRRRGGRGAARRAGLAARVRAGGGVGTRRAAVSGAVGLGGCCRTEDSESPAVGVALAAFSRRGRVVL